MNRLLTSAQYVGIVFAVLSGLFIVLVAYETFLAPPVLEYKNNPLPVLNSPIRPGDAVMFKVERCANDTISDDPVVYTYTRDLVNSTTLVRIALPSGGSDAPHGCATIVSALNLVPPGTPPGFYYVEGISTARGRFKMTTSLWRSQDFEVIQ